MAFDVTKYDYDELVAEITNIVQETDAWKDAYMSSTGQVLIQALASVVDRLHYMLERRTQENFYLTARLDSSIHALSYQSGYRPRRRVSATGTLAMTLFDDSGQVAPKDQIVIPKYTNVNFDGVNFVVTDEHIIRSTSTFPYEIEIMEGKVRTATFDPSESGSTLKEKGYVTLGDFKQIEENSLEVTTSTQVFTDVSKSVGDEPPLESLSFADATTDAYDVRVAGDGLRVLFGDGVNGRKPEGTVTITWIESEGENVEVLSTGSSFSFDFDKFVDSAPVVPALEYTYELVNSTAITGGQEAESAEQIKRRAPDYVRTAGNAVTKHDYAFWTLRSGIGDIVATSAYGENELGSLFSNMNNVYITYLTSTGSELSAEDEQKLREYIDVYKVVTVHTVFQKAELLLAQLRIRAKRAPSLTASNSEIYQRIKEAIASRFQFDDESLGQPIYHSNIVDLLVGLTGTFNGVEKNILDFVHVDINALYEFNVPVVGYQQEVKIKTGAGEHVLKITHGDEQHTHTASDGTISEIVNSLAASINTAHENLTATPDTNNGTITISVNNNDAFLITNEGSSDRQNTEILLDLSVPVPDMVNEENVNQIIPGSVEIVTDSNSVLATDDGNGNIYNGTIDYKTGKMTFPMQDDGTLYVRFQQNENNNINVNIRSAVGLLPPKENYLDEIEKLTTIEILD